MTTKTIFVYGRMYIADAWRVGLGLVGPKWIQVVYLDAGDFATVARIPKAEARHIKPLPGYKNARQVALRMLRGRRVSQMTKRARGILLRAKGAIL